MSKKANPAVVGSFVIGAIIISIVGIMLLGGASMFERKFECILYFDESISGLDIGAPVDFQGVRIGTVTDVRLEFDREKGGEVLRPVKMQIEESRVVFADDSGAMQDPSKGLEALVTQRGLRARLASQSMLTGRQKIELGYFPDQPINRKNRDQGIWEMPTMLSPIKRVTTEMAQLPLTEIVNEAHRAVKGIADSLNPEKTGAAIENLNQTLERLESVLASVQEKIGPFTDHSTEVMKSAKASLDDLQQVLNKIDTNLEPMLKSIKSTSEHVSTMLDPESPVRGEIALLVDDLKDTSKSLRRLTNFLEQHPESLLHGK